MTRGAMFSGKREPSVKYIALSFIGILLYWVGNFDGRPILALGATRPDANAPLVLSVRQGRWHRVGVGLPDGKDVAFRVRHDRIPRRLWHGSFRAQESATQALHLRDGFVE